MSCIFCQINQGALPAHAVEVTEHTHAIMDKFPLSPGHIIVLSKTHASTVSALTSDERAALLDAGHRLSGALKKADDRIKDVHFLINDGPMANQHVPHVHLHVIPRYGWDLAKLPYRFMTRFANPLNYLLAEKRLSSWAVKIRNHLPNTM